MKTKTRGSAWVDGLEIAYESEGTAEPALVFIHGIFGDRSQFALQLEHFSGRRRVVALDLRGHGESSASGEGTIDDFAKDVVGVAEAAGLERAILCGHSMAAVVALEVALARPELVRGVVMLDGTVLFPEEVRRAALSGLLPALSGERWADAVIGYFESRIFDPGDPEDLKQRVVAAVRKSSSEFARSFFAGVFSSDFAAELESAPCPLLYIHAKTPADLERLRRLRPDALVGQVVGSGHYAMLTVPGQVDAMVDRFLEVIHTGAPSPQ